jgi:hypothetical protein
LINGYCCLYAEYRLQFKELHFSQIIVDFKSFHETLMAVWDILLKIFQIVIAYGYKCEGAVQSIECAGTHR